MVLVFWLAEEVRVEPWWLQKAGTPFLNNRFKKMNYFAESILPQAGNK